MAVDGQIDTDESVDEPSPTPEQEFELKRIRQEYVDAIVGLAQHEQIADLAGAVFDLEDIVI
jgi:hypothetical protein